MATNAKIMTLPRPGQNLRPELRDFLDAVIVPALLKKWLAKNNYESSSSISVEAASGDVRYFDPMGTPKPARTKNEERRARRVLREI
jgi:hypothetical protein